MSGWFTICAQKATIKRKPQNMIHDSSYVQEADNSVRHDERRLRYVVVWRKTCSRPHPGQVWTFLGESAKIHVKLQT
jgi:hypothetical protein